MLIIVYAIILLQKPEKAKPVVRQGRKAMGLLDSRSSKRLPGCQR